ncbi:MAG: radical SAM protein [Chthonomonadetes bacterium]|nr:radical SAM protein [Chthonomonadetes bacterium]
MLTGVHFLLTYKCPYECDHCFVYSSPRAKGTFTLAQITTVLAEARKLGTVQTIFFEGGEPFLYYPLLLEGVRRAREMGFQTGIVTNGYFATSVEDALLWLKPLQEAGVGAISFSDDLFHSGSEEDTPAKRALAAAQQLGISCGVISISPPTVTYSEDNETARGEPIVGGGVRFRGRAVERLTQGLPTRPWQSFTECPYENLRDPGRVHVDAYGNVHLCQGLSMGNLWQTPLSELVRAYQAEKHPLCAPLVEGGPAELAKRYEVPVGEGYIEACHLCYLVRRALIRRFPEYLAPRQVYGLL